MFGILDKLLNMQHQKSRLDKSHQYVSLAFDRTEDISGEEGLTKWSGSSSLSCGFGQQDSQVKYRFIVNGSVGG